MADPGVRATDRRVRLESAPRRSIQASSTPDTTKAKRIRIFHSTSVLFIEAMFIEVSSNSIEAMATIDARILNLSSLKSSLPIQCCGSAAAAALDAKA
jgi:hypothetical protein